MGRWRKVGAVALLLMPLLGPVLAGVAAELARRLGVAMMAGQVFGFSVVAFLVLAFLALAPSKRASVTVGGERWITDQSRWQLSGRFAAPPAILMWLAFALGGGSSTFIALLSSIFGIGFAAVPAFALVEKMLRGDASAPHVTLDEQTLTVQSDGGIKVFRYDAIRSIEHRDKAVWLVTANEKLRIHVAGREERAEALADAITLARSRAAAPGPHGDLAGPTALLRRADGTTAREWLARIDALAPNIEGGHAYRGAGLDTEALLTALDDPHATADTRVAAARLLARSPDEDVKVRVATAIGKVDEEDLRIRIGLGMKADLEEAASEIEAMDLDATAREVGR